MKRALSSGFLGALLLSNVFAYASEPISDRDMAARYLKAAQTGDQDAQFYLGALYSTGIGLTRSDEEAFRWVARAADQGQSHAMLVLAGLYATGRGTTKDNLN